LLLVVAAALTDREGRVLIAQRPPGKQLAGLWEFPGGKLDAGERPEEALARELAEELGVIVETRDLTPLAFASHAYEAFHLLMPLYLCRRWRGEPQPREGQALAWKRASELDAATMPPADAPLIAPLAALLG
jgi:8-oxo-dGTP diphosphatase